MKAGSNLEKVLSEGHFAVTAELGPPRGTDTAVVEKKAGQLRASVDAVNVTDNQSAMVHMSSIACAALLVRQGVEPVMQMTCRDRNRIAIQSDILGASALGVKNILCISGDHHSLGDQPGAKKVYDIDSTQLVAAVKRLRDEQRVLGNDEEVSGKVPLFIGTAANPFAFPYAAPGSSPGKESQRGGGLLPDAMRVRRGPLRGLDGKGQGARGAHQVSDPCRGNTPEVLPHGAIHGGERARDNHPRVDPEADGGGPKEKGAAEGIKICCEIIRQLKDIEGVAGVHIMAIEWEHRVPEIVSQAGLLPRPACAGRHRWIASEPRRPPADRRLTFIDRQTKLSLTLWQIERAVRLK